MLTAILMIVLLICMAAIWGYGLKLRPSTEDGELLSRDHSIALRGFWCLIVILVHIPELYMNRIQDMIGSFAYIGVTFFFMTSAYGLRLKLDRDPGYMNRFWRRRLPAILVPALIAQAADVIYRICAHDESALSLFKILNINDWVKVLLICYLTFWCIYRVLPVFIKIPRLAQDLILVIVISALSLTDRLSPFKPTLIWIVEPLGFAYGVIAAAYSEKIVSYIRSKTMLKIIITMVISAVLGAAYLRFKPVAFWGDYLLKIILGIAILSFMFCLLAKFRIGNAVTAFIGGISYEIYLLHETVFDIIGGLDKSASLDSGLFIWTSVFITIVLSVMLKALSGLILKPMRSGSAGS